MNKLPWFTHDHDAHEDLFIQSAMDRFGHFGYAGYFIILELLHRHGTGDSLRIPMLRLCHFLRTKSDSARIILGFFRDSGKMDVTFCGDVVEIKIKKFRERQSKLKSNLPSTFRQPSVNLPIEGEGEGDKEITPPLPPPPGGEPVGPGRKSEPKPYQCETFEQRVICCVKVLKGLDMEDRGWDRANYSRNIPAAAKICAAFGIDRPKAEATGYEQNLDAMLSFVEDFEKKMRQRELSWSLATAARHAWDDSSTTQWRTSKC